MPLLSVLLPVKNGDQTIEGAVRSTLRGMPKDSELVVFNDGSTDRTVSKLATIVDSRLRIDSSDESRGVAMGLNHLLEITDSKYVARMDADDYSLPWRFIQQLHALRSGTDVVFTHRVDWRPERKRVTPTAPLAISDRAFPYYLMLSNPVAHSTMAALRQTVVSVGGYRNVPSEDYDLWLRLAAARADLRRLALWGLAYRLHPSQITASTEWRHRSWSDPLIAEAFSLLSVQRLGEPSRRLVAIGADQATPQADLLRELGEFGRRFKAAIHHLERPERYLVKRKLAQRITDVTTAVMNRAAVL
ncbi:glycosyltransferase [Nakamurella antarctica]|uniref:Glycosyltransferase n=1 Tax=Nakamurella antarctica TaxID=1902245 RepID=A0A3G8ZU86_9ACTN|nr:glycosyltransferase [Nakamurella antarctica]AZI57351.1 glycosyltransferase [Nakamurella antarctica]